MSKSIGRYEMFMGMLSMLCLIASVLLVAAAVSDVIDARRWEAVFLAGLSLLVLVSVTAGVQGFASIWGKLGLIGAVAFTVFVLVFVLGLGPF